MTETEGRLIAVETALAHAEAAVEELSEVVRGQSDRLDRLARQVEAMARRLAELEDAAAAGPGATQADVRPPHW